ncbi:MAG: serine/threonine protein kinase, partial [Kiritimatiellia bacterium]
MIADRYVIERLIARGGMAAVYLASQVKLSRKVAIKILRPPPDSDESGSFHERFRLEAETLAQLNHQNIVTIYDHGDFDDDQVFLAMEFVDGKRLTDLLREGPMQVDRALNLLLQVCEALRYAHRRGVVHRDLKPSNLLITRTDDDDELLKVVDFGLVKLTEVDVTITSAGLILGSPHCMAPEQVRGLDVDARTDIYAVGVLLFRSLTGTYPFHGANSTATMIAHLNQATPTFFSVQPDLEVPDGLENVVRRCLAKNRAERFQSMEELMDALAYFLNVSPDQYRTVSRTHATLERFAPVIRRRTPLWVYAAGGLGALVLLGVIGAAGIMVGISLIPSLTA